MNNKLEKTTKIIDLLTVGTENGKIIWTFNEELQGYQVNIENELYYDFVLWYKVDRDAMVEAPLSDGGVLPGHWKTLNIPKEGEATFYMRQLNEKYVEDENGVLDDLYVDTNQYPELKEKLAKLGDTILEKGTRDILDYALDVLQKI